MLKYVLEMEVTPEGYIPPAEISKRFPFLTVLEAPSELELAEARGLLRPFMTNQSITPDELLERLVPWDKHPHLLKPIVTREGTELSIQRRGTPTKTWYELMSSEIMNEPRVLQLTEIIAIIDYCGGLDADG